ncbi:hypothetical protein HMPREF0083_03664 [Aneurinibacillus aneurinilyticus ATCC 12856]|uniref:Uncharacterized protein n=1 Tax=Aneurinibacillus aneurinilyticus ATCC 12856 TaxID=649747 RepID=U1WI47_ANEAE|nr:hypothetical protein HMPREF0083_03664 [Aneurinibacillus aneurinilyticus ATCC 12856]
MNFLLNHIFEGALVFRTFMVRLFLSMYTQLHKKAFQASLTRNAFPL